MRGLLYRYRPKQRGSREVGSHGRLQRSRVTPSESHIIKCGEAGGRRHAGSHGHKPPFAFLAGAGRLVFFADPAGSDR